MMAYMSLWSLVKRSTHSFVFQGVKLMTLFTLDWLLPAVVIGISKVRDLEPMLGDELLTFC